MCRTVRLSVPRSASELLLPISFGGEAALQLEAKVSGSYACLPHVEPRQRQ